MDEIASGRSVDIELGGQEVISIDLDNLDPNPDDVLDLLKEGQCKIWVWTKLAGEYWRRGYLEPAERIANAAIDCTFELVFRRVSLVIIMVLSQRSKQRGTPINSLLSTLCLPIFRWRGQDERQRSSFRMHVS